MKLESGSISQLLIFVDKARKASIKGLWKIGSSQRTVAGELEITSCITEEAPEDFKSQNIGPTLESEGLDKKHMKAGFICTDSGLNSAEVPV